MADYALREIRRLKDDDQDAMEKIPWLDHFTKRGDDGKMIITENWPPGFEHHVGCLFAHLFAWQMALDGGKPDSVIFESDGVTSANLAVPLETIQFSVDNAPRDYDVLFLNKLKDPRLNRRLPIGNDAVKSARDDAGGAEIQYFKYQNPMAAGLSGYAVSDRFLKKIHTRIAERGADMVDAWLYKLCADPTDERTGEDKVTFLTCYAGVDKKIVDRFDQEHPDGA